MSHYYSKADQIITSGSMTGASTITSDVIDLRNASRFSVQSIWTGTPTGTLTIQVSAQAYPSSWTTLTDSDQATGGAAGDFIHNVSAAGYSWARLSYTNSSSTGTLNAYATVKRGG